MVVVPPDVIENIPEAYAMFETFVIVVTLNVFFDITTTLILTSLIDHYTKLIYENISNLLIDIKTLNIEIAGK